MLTYPGFHLVFVVPPILLLGWSLRRRAGRGLGARRPLLAAAGLVLMALFALAYTTPWDNFLIRQGVWWYGEGAVYARLGDAPLSEYLFFLLQPVMAALWLYHLSPSPTDETPINARGAGALAGLSLTAVGNALWTTAPGYYLGAILVWAGPVLTLQWFIGGPYLWRVRRTVALAVAAPTVYLWCADRVALGLGVWTISTDLSTGLAPLGLPVEEAIFFLVTNTLVVQGIVLLFWVADRLPSLPELRRSTA